MTLTLIHNKIKFRVFLKQGEFMKKFSIFYMILALIITTVMFTSCGNDNSNSSSSSTEVTTEATTQTTTAPAKEDNLFIGSWQLEEENGENHTLFTYIFENDTQAFMAMDNVAYGAEYILDVNVSGKKTISIQFYYNLNGTYLYEFSEDGKKVTLTEDGKENSVVMTMNKVEDYNFMPEAPKTLEIDEKLVGTWKDKNNTGISYEFSDNGTVIYNNYNVVITYAQYSAKDGKINLTYTMGSEVTDSYNYSFEGDVLTIDSLEFVKQ